jgi:hypothetical protein
VRSVVVTLLDSEQNGNSSRPSGSVEQYEGVLLSFLTLLTQIENVGGHDSYGARQIVTLIDTALFRGAIRYVTVIARDVTVHYLVVSV